jgi:hypothetical protein
MGDVEMPGNFQELSLGVEQLQLAAVTRGKLEDAKAKVCSHSDVDVGLRGCRQHWGTARN